MKYPNKTLDGAHPRILVTELFVQQNRLTLARSSSEIVREIKDRGNFNFGGEVLFHYLKREDLAPIAELVPDDYQPITDVYEAVQDFLDYMVFGWGKALDERGLSSSRTIDKLGAWLWLFGREDLMKLIDQDDLYNPYGMPALIAACEALQIDVPDDCREFAKHPCK